MIDPMAQLFKGLRGGSWRCSPRCREICEKDHRPKAVNIAFGEKAPSIKHKS